MSNAQKCDRCGDLFEHQHGTIIIDEISVGATRGKCTSWSDLDLCPKCSKLVLDVMAPALAGLRRPSR